MKKRWFWLLDRKEWSPGYGIMATFGLMWSWLAVLVFILHRIAGSTIQVFRSDIALGVLPRLLQRAGLLGQMTFWQAFVSACIFAPLTEEFLFRWLPIEYLAKNRKTGEIVRTWPMWLISWFFFGWLHQYSLVSVAFQGVFGMMLARLWVMNNASKERSYVSCIIAHSLYNFSILMVSSGLLS